MEIPFEHRLTASPKEVEVATGWSHATIYRKLRAGSIEAIKDGRRTRIVVASVLRHLDGLPRLKTAEQRTTLQ